MGMPMELNTMIVTKGKEVRMEENVFELTKDGYRMYPIDIPIAVHRTRESECSGMAKVEKLQWMNNETCITYRLLSLNSTN